MRVLIVKMSSMGDVIHTLPAVTDAKKKFPNIEFDWLVEPSFAEIPKWHPAVGGVILAPLRQYRKRPWQALKNGEWLSFVRDIRQKSYDAVVDAQGILKSGIVTLFTQGKKYGFHHQSSRGGFISLVYGNKIQVENGLHAVEKVRHLFAKALGYPLPADPPDYGIDYQRLKPISYGDNTVIFLHGTTWATKHWPESYWQQLAELTANEYQVLIPFGNEGEKARAEGIKDYCQNQKVNFVPIVLPKLSLGEITSLIAKAKGIVAVDTGLGHIAAAMATPTLSLYGPTDPKLTGAYGPNQFHLSASFPCSPCLSKTCKKGNDFPIMPPCFSTLPPQLVWEKLKGIIQKERTVAT